MNIIPAIDLKDGVCVRLKQGVFSEQTVYSKDPCAVAKKWEAQGAHMLHIVDLDGAKDGVMKNLAHILAIRSSVSIPIEVGGGIRSIDMASSLIEKGIDRVIVGTIALEEPALLQSLIEKHGEKISVALDAKEGKLVSRGWVSETEMDVKATAKGLELQGVSRIHYTDVLKDGTLSTPNMPAIASLVHMVHIPCVVGGGISSLQDIQTLSQIGAEGVVLGKALYEDAFSVHDVIVCLQNASFPV